MSLINDNNLTDLYNFNPAYGNEFTVEFLNLENDNNELSGYFQLHATSVTFQGESLDLSRNEITKKFQVKSNQAYKRTDILKIKIREDNKWRIKDYMDGWISNIYDRKSDKYISQDNPKSIYRIIRVYPNYDNKDTNISFTVLPKLSPGVDLKWSQNPSIIEYGLEFYVEEWWFNLPSLSTSSRHPDESKAVAMGEE